MGVFDVSWRDASGEPRDLSDLAQEAEAARGPEVELDGGDEVLLPAGPPGPAGSRGDVVPGPGSPVEPPGEQWMESTSVPLDDGTTVTVWHRDG